MKLETIELSQLSPASYNPREISKEEFEGLKESLKTFGQQENLIVNKDMTIISGHQRYEAMKALKWTEAVCNMVDLDKHQEKKLNVIMNSTAISGKYDDLKLSEILEELKLDDDYESLRLDKLEPLDLSDIEVEEDEAPEVSSEPPVSKLGEVYQLGRHRVMCGDSTKDLDRLLDGAVIDLVHTDPPYGIDADKMTMGSGAKDFHRGEWDNTAPDVTYLLDLADKVCIWGGNYFTNVLPANNDWLCWHKKNDNLSFSEFELAWTNYGKNTRHISHHWGAEKKQHVTMKPIEVCAWAIKLAGEVNTVLDTYLGSGSTLIACEQTDRICYGCELDPKYVDVIRKRYWKFTHDGNEEGWEDGTTN
jgi:DNA modification methylase